MMCTERVNRGGKSCLEFDPYGWGVWCNDCWREDCGIRGEL